DERLLEFLSERLRDAQFSVIFLQHDLRNPLPGELRRRFETVFTDPPYTVAGGTLFLSRAVDAAGPGQNHVFFAFGPKRPEEVLQIQQSMAEMRLVNRQLLRGFNEYVGAGIIGGMS